MARGGRGGGSRYGTGDPGSSASSYGGGHRMSNKSDRRGANAGSGAMPSSRRGSSHWRPPTATGAPGGAGSSRTSSANRVAANPPPPPNVIDLSVDVRAGAVDLSRRPPPPPVTMATPAIEAVGHPSEVPRPYDPSKAGVDPRSVIAVAERLGPVTAEALMDAWRQMEARSKAARAVSVSDTTASTSSCKYSYTIAQMLKIKDSTQAFVGDPAYSGFTGSTQMTGSSSGHLHRRQQGYSPPSQGRASSAATDSMKIKEWRAAPPPPPPPPANRPELSRAQKLRRQTKSLLNKLTVEKFQAIAEMLVHDILETCSDENELSIIVDEVYKKAVSEPDFSEMYADLVLVFRAKSPQFPSLTGGKPTDFKRCIVVRCQREFESMQAPEQDDTSLLTPEDAERARIKRKRLILGNMRFIGELYMRMVISTSALRNIVCVMIETSEPEPHIIECLCELLTTIGFTLDQQCGDTSKMILSTLSLLRHKFEPRIDCKILDLLDLARNGWRQRSVKFNTSQSLESQVAGLQSYFPYKSYVHELDDAHRARQKELRQKSKQPPPPQQQQQPQENK